MATYEIIKKKIVTALAIRKKLLNKYYTMTDQSEVYRIAMSKYSTLLYLDPLIMLPTSSTPKPQARVFLKCRLAGGMDYHSVGGSEGRVRTVVRRCWCLRFKCRPSGEFLNSDGFNV